MIKIKKLVIFIQNKIRPFEFKKICSFSFPTYFQDINKAINKNDKLNQHHHRIILKK